jgi:N-acetylmuramoyl-L-alanine amidase
MGERKLGMGQTHELTRRTLLGGVAAAGAASLVGPAAGLADVLVGRRPVRSRWVGTLSGESLPLLAPARFELAGIQWSSPEAAEIELRAQALHGRWSPWVVVSSLGHAGDGQAASGGLFGEPVWTGPAERVQLRTSRTVHGLRVHFVTVGTPTGAGHTAGALPLAQPVLDAGPGQPPIIARRAWAAGQAHPVHTPEYGSVKLAFVHHTVNPNGYSAGAVPALLRGIFDYHVQVRGFWDIAYNFIIDAYGRIWEARAGGIDMAVMGAHAGAYNLESTGVAILGDFMNVLPSPAAIKALQRLLAWKLSLHGIPAKGRVTVVVDPSGAFYTPFPPGAHVSLPRVAGHRDGDLTDCPGNALYGQLPAIRPGIVSLSGTPARLTIAAPRAPLPAGSTVALSGILQLLSGAPLAGEAIEIQQLGPSGPPANTLATTTTASNGSWNASLGFQRNTLVRALHRPRPASVADWALVAVTPVITLSEQSSSPLVLTGTVTPAKRQVTLALYPAGRTQRKPLKRKRVIAARGVFTARMSVPPPGSYVAVARTQADASNTAGASAPLAITVS